MAVPANALWYSEQSWKNCASSRQNGGNHQHDNQANEKRSCGRSIVRCVANLAHGDVIEAGDAIAHGHPTELPILRQRNKFGVRFQMRGNRQNPKYGDKQKWSEEWYYYRHEEPNHDPILGRFRITNYAAPTVVGSSDCMFSEHLIMPPDRPAAN